MSVPRVAIIGGGLGALAAAVRLAHAGLGVRLFERNKHTGGKMSRLESHGFHWDMGPSLLTMPDVIRELWRDVGSEADNDLEILPLRSTCRYRWLDGTVIEEDNTFWQRPEIAAYLRHAKGIYDLSADAFLRHAPDELSSILTPARIPLLRHLPKVADPRSLHQLNKQFFRHDPHLLQLFDRFATYNGSSPYKTPAVFSIIAYVQAAFGGHYLQGGMFALARALTQLAASKGAEIATSHDVRSIRREANGKFRVEFRNGSHESGFDRIVCNMDAIRAPEKLFGVTSQRAHLRHPPSTSGFILFLGLDRCYPELDHHNILFSDDYPREFREMADGIPAAEPTIYIAIGSRTDPQMSPLGQEGWFVLVNAPATGGFDWEKGASAYADSVLDRIERFGFAVRPHIVCRHIFTPADFERRDLAWRGTLYGFASHGLMSSFQRPPITRNDLPGVYFAGGTTHPGGGVPLVLLSGQIAARKLLKSLSKVNTLA